MSRILGKDEPDATAVAIAKLQNMSCSHIHVDSTVISKSNDINCSPLHSDLTIMIFHFPMVSLRKY